jgi:hypothetical protein
MMCDQIEIVALHRHFVTAQAIKHFISADVPETVKTDELDEDLLEAAKLISRVFRLQVFYALLYVVVEGFQELGCHDPAVDSLLARSELVTALKRFRNGTFHFQPEPITTPKVEELVDIPGSEEWTFGLYVALQAFFEKSIPMYEMVKALPQDPAIREYLKSFRELD